MTVTPTQIDERETGSEGPGPRRRRPWIVEFYGSDVGKKYAMAVSGILLMAYVLAHMLGNLKVYLGPEEINAYGEALRDLGEHLVPRTHLLWILRIVLAAAFVVHIHAAWALTVKNSRARPYEQRYRSRRDYVVADFASRTMRWTGVIVAGFVVYHLADMTWGHANPGFVRGSVYRNFVASFEQVPVAVVYLLAQLALGIHLYHGSWSLFQSLGVSNPRFNHWRRAFAVGFAALITVGNLSFPIAVQLGIVD